MDYARQNARALRAWSEFGMAYTKMLMSANEVIVRRTHQMATGAMSKPEAAGMVMEKMTAMAVASEKAAVAAAMGANPMAIATAALRPYGAKTRSNARRLRK
jgi:hypothetical protein